MYIIYIYVYIYIYIYVCVYIYIYMYMYIYIYICDVFAMRIVWLGSRCWESLLGDVYEQKFTTYDSVILQLYYNGVIICFTD